MKGGEGEQERQERPEGEMEGLRGSEKGVRGRGGKGGVPAGRDLSEPRPTAGECGVCLLGADWKNDQNPPDSPSPTPQQGPEILPRDPGGSRGRAEQVVEKPKA